MKKLIVFLLISILTQSASAFGVDGIEYDINDDGQSVILRSGSGCNGAITIPENVTHAGNTYSVTSIGGHAFYYCNNLTSVTIPNSVTSIGGQAFSYCKNLTSVTIPNSVTSIGWEAFSHCNNLTSVTIPNSVTSIGRKAFSYCKNLTSVTIPNSVTSIDENAFEGCTGLTAVHIFDIAAWCNIKFYDGYRDQGEDGLQTNPLCYAHHLYLKGKEIKNLVIPNTISSIRNSTFNGCSGLTSVTIPNSVTSIGKHAFEGCTGLTSVTIPNSVTTIGVSAFAMCRGLTSVTIGNSVTFGNSEITGRYIRGSYPFGGCDNIREIYVGWEWPADGSLFDDDFDYLHTRAILYVPAGTFKRYLYHPVWGQFKMIEEYTPRKAKSGGGAKKKGGRRR